MIPKFRGISIADDSKGKMQYGYLIADGEQAFIINEVVEANEQYIIRTSAYGCIVGFGEYTYFEDENTPITEIGFYLSFLNVTPATYAPFDKYYWNNCEVIGNIYENELDLIVYEAYKYNKGMSEVTE